jgi:hypothetical protein
MLVGYDYCYKESRVIGQPNSRNKKKRVGEGWGQGGRKNGDERTTRFESPFGALGGVGCLTINRIYIICTCINLFLFIYLFLVISAQTLTCFKNF